MFKLATIKRELDLAQTMAWVSRKHGMSYGRQVAVLARLMYGPTKIEPQDYFKLGLFRSEIAATAGQQYIGDKAGRRMNEALGPARTAQRALLGNKMLTGHVLTGAGFRVPRSLAYYSAAGSVPGLKGLDDAAGLADYLRTVDLPVFGKPVDASLGIGATSFMSRSETGLIRFGDGREFAPESIAAEIAQHFPRGYLFQELVRQPQTVRALAGPAVGSMRVVTIWGGDGPRGLYCVLRLPAKGAMMDAHSQSQHAICHVELTTGRVIRTQNMDQMCIATATEAPATGASVIGVTLPDVPQAVAMCEASHRLFPTQGVLGYDVMLTEDGPIFGEVNTNPSHMLYQRAADRGVMNADFAPRLADALSATLARIAARSALTATGKRSG